MSHEKNPNIKISTLLDIIMLGQIDTLKTVLDQCAERRLKIDLNEQDELGNFVAIFAAQRNNLPLLKLLVDHGAAPSLSPDCKDGGGRTVIGWAKKHKNVDMIAYISQINSSPLDKVEKSISSTPLPVGKSSSMPTIIKPTINGH